MAAEILLDNEGIAPADRPEFDVVDIIRQFRKGDDVRAIAQRYQLRDSEVQSIIRYAMRPRYF